jgi:hypothetical protein
MKNSSKFRHSVAGLGLLLLLMGSSASAAGGTSIAEDFKTDDPNIVTGMLVSSRADAPDSIEPSTTSNLTRLTGVVGYKSLIELSKSESKGVQVVTSGVVAALVSDINGPVHKGDKITASPIAGVGMKATTSTLVIGAAQADLTSVTVRSRSVTDKNGKKKDVAIGALPIEVQKGLYETSQDQGIFLLSGFQSAATRFTGHQVSLIRILIATFLILFLSVAVLILLYSAVRSSIISIGRNPLSADSVRKSLLQVGLIAVGALCFGAVVVFFVLKG